MENIMKSGCFNWDNFQNPDVIKSNLLISAIFLLSYEFLRTRAITRVEDFFRIPVNPRNPTGSGWRKTYESELLQAVENARKSGEIKKDAEGKKPSPIEKAISWFIDNGVLDDADRDSFNKLTDFRNEIAHRLIMHIDEVLIKDYVPFIGTIQGLFTKIEQWSARCEPLFDITGEPVEIDPDDIIPMPVLLMRMIINMAFDLETHDSQNTEHQL
jgi:uncharacterized protein YutE (UPF0331/DUF86 family)